MKFTYTSEGRNKGIEVGLLQFTNDTLFICEKTHVT